MIATGFIEEGRSQTSGSVRKSCCLACFLFVIYRNPEDIKFLGAWLSKAAVKFSSPPSKKKKGKKEVIAILLKIVLKSIVGIVRTCDSFLKRMA